MSRFLGERDIPHPTSVKVSRLFPFLFTGDLVSQCPQGQNLLWCICNLSSVNEIVKQRWFGSGFVTGERKSFCPLIYREISVWRKYTHLFAVLFSPGIVPWRTFGPGGNSFVVQACLRAKQRRQYLTHTCHRTLQYTYQLPVITLLLLLSVFRHKLWILAYQNMHVWWPKFCIFIRCQALLLFSITYILFLCPVVCKMVISVFSIN